MSQSRRHEIPRSTIKYWIVEALKEEKAPPVTAEQGRATTEAGAESDCNDTSALQGEATLISEE